MNENNESRSRSGTPIVVTLPFVFAAIWSVFNWSRLLAWTETLEQPLSDLAWWVALAFIANGVLIVALLVLVLTIIVFGGLWLLAGKTTDGWNNNL